MARVTVDDCLEKEENPFKLVLLASQRALQMLDGASPLTITKGNKPVVVALREIAHGKIRAENKKK